MARPDHFHPLFHLQPDQPRWIVALCSDVARTLVSAASRFVSTLFAEAAKSCRAIDHSSAIWLAPRQSPILRAAATSARATSAVHEDHGDNYHPQRGA